MSPEDREHIALVINFFWGEIAAPNQVNESVARLAYESLESASNCTAAMHLGPRSPSSKPGVSFIVKQFAAIAKRVAEDDSRIYQLCRQRIQVNHMSPMRLALMGL